MYRRTSVPWEHIENWAPWMIFVEECGSELDSGRYRGVDGPRFKTWNVTTRAETGTTPPRRMRNWIIIKRCAALTAGNRTFAPLPHYRTVRSGFSRVSRVDECGRKMDDFECKIGHIETKSCLESFMIKSDFLS